MSARALLAVGEHLEQVTQLIKSQASAVAEERELEQLAAVLSRSTAVLGQASQQGMFGVCAPGVSPAFSNPVSIDLPSDRGISRPLPAPIVTDPTTPASADNKGGSGSEADGSESPRSVQHQDTLFEPKTSKGTKSSHYILRRMETIMESHYVECFFAFLILLNVGAMILEAQFEGAKIGHEIGYHHWYGSPAFFTDTGAPTSAGFHHAEIFFATLFTAEVFLRIILLRCDFLRDPWGWLDMSVVLITDLILVLALDFLNLSVVRALRLARLLRIVRLARKIQAFDSLYLMTTALKGSCLVLMWVVVLIFIIQTVIALVLANVVQGWYLKPPSNTEDWMSAEVKAEVYEYWGTYWRAMVSLFELMLANWPPICRMMMEDMSEVWSAFVIAYKLTMGFAVIGVIFGVFTQETFRAAETDDQLMLRKKTAQTQLHTRKMKLLFSIMARNHDLPENGQIDLGQFKSFLANPDVQLWLKAMDYDTSDAGLLFYLIDKDGDGRLSVEELIEGMGMLKGGARNIDVKLMLRQSTVGRMQRAQMKVSGRRVSATEALRILESGDVTTPGPTTPMPSPTDQGLLSPEWQPYRVVSGVSGQSGGMAAEKDETLSC